MEKEWRVIIMLDFFSMLLARAGYSGGGGGGFTPTTEQLAAMNSGITAEKLQNDENNISNCSTKLTGVDSTANNAIKMNNGVTLYFGSTTPSNPQNGDWWLD